MGRPRKCWSWSTGSHGYTVTVCERRPGGHLHLRWWVSAPGGGGQWHWRSLKHDDQDVGKRAAREVSAHLAAHTMGEQTGALTMAELFARYEREVSAHKKGTGATEDARRVAIWTHFLGGSRVLSSLDFPTVDRFVRERRAGSIQPFAGSTDANRRKLPSSPSDRAIGADIIFLHAALNWATRVRRADGRPLLVANPIRGYKAPANKNPRRPLATYDRYLKVRAKADEADPQGLFGAFLDLVEGLGWRVSAICGLLASDLSRAKVNDAPCGAIHKRGDADKEGVDGWVPMSESVRAAVDRLRELHVEAGRPVIGDVPLFPSPKRHAGGVPRAWTRWHARDLLERAEKLAELAPLDGSDFHAYRRAWASARKDLPLTDVAAAGGWRDLRSLETCYTLPDAKTILRVVTTTAKIRDAGA